MYYFFVFHFIHSHYFFSFLKYLKEILFFLYLGYQALVEAFDDAAKAAAAKTNAARRPMRSRIRRW